jgi:bacterioferritin-associated ferredoxin
MIVCSCNVLSDAAIRSACAAGEAPRTPGQVYRCLGCSAQCGRCARTIRAILDDALEACPPACATCPAHHTRAQVDAVLSAMLEGVETVAD